jgi:hypothetical protein
VVAIGTKVQLSCSTTGQAAIKKKYPKSNHTWILNDVKLSTNQTRMKAKGLKLEISNITPNDQGLYTCRIFYTKKQGKTVYFATLITKNIGIPKEILETNTLKMRCPSSPIGRLFRKSVPIKTGCFQINFLYLFFGGGSNLILTWYWITSQILLEDLSTTRQVQRPS